MHPRAKAQRIEVLIGILGFFDLIALVNAAVTFFEGRSELQPMIVLVGCTALLVTSVRIRERMTL